MKHGVAFGDHIKTERLSSRHYSPNDKDVTFRGPILLITLIIIVAVLFIRLSYLQIIKGSYYQSLSDANRTRTNIIFAPRGIIFDKNNKTLVYNVPGFRQTKEGQSRIIDNDVALSLLAKGESGIDIDNLRRYPLKESMVHVLGYVGQISIDETKQNRFSSYPANSWIGKAGIEWQYEARLRGRDGRQLVEVDALGRKVRTLGQTDPIPGEDITLTVDSVFQEKVYKAMAGVTRGVAIVATAKGEILALVSKPSFDPNFFTLTNYHNSEAEYDDASEVLADDTNQPLLNRAIGGTYPPGSTFKLVTAAVGLEKNIINASYRVEDVGILKINDFSFANWFYTQYGRTDGIVDVVKGIARSNDIFFYKTAEKIGVEILSENAKKFGLGNVLGIDLPGEAKGIVPSDSWKRKAVGEQWYLGDTYHYGIGQGYLLTTPLQVNAWTQVIANGGSLYEPHLLKTQNSKLKTQKFLSETNISLIREGMVQSCKEGGVAWPLFEFRIKNAELRIDGRNFLEDPKATTSADFKDYRKVTIACKTGTAQHGGLETLPHAWITLFAPAYDPQIVVTVLSEESGEGSNVAAPIAKKILEAWFEQKPE